MAIDVTNAAPEAERQILNYGWRDFFRTATVNSETLHNAIHINLSGADADGDEIEYVIKDAPQYGILRSDGTSGGYWYSPTSSFKGADHFTYTVSDGISESFDAPVHITNALPVAVRNDQLFWADNGEPQFDYGYPILGSPSESVEIQIVDGPTQGTISDSYWYTDDFLEATISPAYDLFSEFPDLPIDWLDQVKYWGMEYQPPTSFTSGIDPATAIVKVGNISTKPFKYMFRDPGQSWTDLRHFVPRVIFDVSAEAESEFSGEFTRWKDSNVVSLSIGQQPQHGTVELLSDGGFEYEPDYKPDDNIDDEPYLGWDFFVVTCTDAAGVQYQNWVQLNVGISAPPSPRPTVSSFPIIVENATSVPATLSGLQTGYNTAKNMLRNMLEGLAELGQAVGQVKNASDTEILNKLDAASAPIDDIAEQYEQYVKQLAGLNKAAGEFLASQWYISQADSDAVLNINKLPTNVGSLKMSRDMMVSLAESLDSLGKGAGIAVDTANKVVTYAENTHAVLSTVEMAGGVTVLVKTGATLLVKEGLKACAKQAAVELMQNVASATAAHLANYAAELAGVPQEYRQYIAIGVDAYQTFAFFKAAKVKMDPNGACFVAGTGVLSGVDVNGCVYRNIEDIEVGDYVLSRDQHDPDDDLDYRRVTNVFRRTSDHLRILTIEGDDGNIEVIKTTDEHPFYVQGKGWVSASQLSDGDLVQESDGSWQAVPSSTRESRLNGITVYNLEVEGDHTYFVEDGFGEADAVWVHNTCSFGFRWGHGARHLEGTGLINLTWSPRFNNRSKKPLEMQRFLDDSWVG